MKINYAFPVILAMLLSACGTAFEPTMNSEDLKSTAIANAWMIITQTQAALPTPTSTLTPMPPTETPAPTVTLLPTVPPLQPTIVEGSPTANPCNDVPPVEPKGTTVRIRLLNKSAGVVTSLSFGMLAPNSSGECGTYAFYLVKLGTVETTVMAGCYWAYAYIDTPSIAKNPDGSYLCVTDTTKSVDIWVTDELVNFH